MYYCRPYLFVDAEDLKFIYFAYKSCCLMQYKSRLQLVSSYGYIKYYIISMRYDTVVGTMRTGATAGSEGRTACLQLTKTTDMQAAILNLSTSLLGFSFEVVSLGSALDSCSNAAAKSNIWKIYCTCSN